VIFAQLERLMQKNILPSSLRGLHRIPTADSGLGFGRAGFSQNHKQKIQNSTGWTVVEAAV